MDQRGSGILLHISSLPSSYGIGDLGPEAYNFSDFLQKTRQRYWQVLPLTPTDPLHGNSPYSSLSAFAGNTLLISPESLVADGLLSRRDLSPVPAFPRSSCDFPKLTLYKKKLLGKAFQGFNRQGKGHESFESFCAENFSWLDDFAFFTVLKKRFKGKRWNFWPQEAKNRSVHSISAMKRAFHQEILKEKFFQYLFFHQWHALKDYCKNKGICIMGDLPIYVGMDSSDTWANPGLFKLDKEKKPFFVSGVPPDYFSSSGQLWNTPVYDWDAHKETGYHWWIERIAHNLLLFDLFRIDHFRGLVAYWEIPAGEKTAIHGKWVKAPANQFLVTLKQKFPGLPIVAEDLGFITPDVRKIMERFNLPGMKILQFAFTEAAPEPSYLPHAHERNCIVYTGTHDNNTARGWFEEDATANDRKTLFRYIGKRVSAQEIHWEFIRLALMSVAKTAIIPMQDVLGLGADARMNRPSVAGGNWGWRLAPGQITPRVKERLLEMTETYGRCPSRCCVTD